jgi:hypothetical protein
MASRCCVCLWMYFVSLAIRGCNTDVKRLNSCREQRFHEKLLIVWFVNKLLFVRFEVLTAVTMKSAAFWDVTLCDSCKNLHFTGTCRLRH